MKNTAKKKGFIQTFAEESGLIQSIIAIMIIAAVIGVDYGITLIECHYGKWEPVIGVKIVLMIANLIVIGFLFFFTVALVTGLIPRFILAIKRLPAIYRYCFIPLTEEEVKDHGFTSAKEYFNYVKEQLWYGKAEIVDRNYRYYNPCVLLTQDDTRKMLTVCTKVFGAASIFKLQEDDLMMLGIDFDLDEFIHFIRDYHVLEKDNDIRTSAVIKEDGRVELSYQIKGPKHTTRTYETVV